MENSSYNHIEKKGLVQISFLESDDPSRKYSVTLTDTNISAYTTLVLGLSQYHSMPTNRWDASPFELINDKNSNSWHIEPKENEAGLSSMTDMNRSEFSAHLKASKAESEAVAAGMKTEMANFRTAYVEHFAEISKTLSRIESKADATEKRLTQAQWIISAVIALCALTISISFNISSKSHIQPASQQAPITINTLPPSYDTQKK